MLTYVALGLLVTAVVGIVLWLALRQQGAADSGNSNIEQLSPSNPAIARLIKNPNRLADAEIAATLQMLPGAEWYAAHHIQERLAKEDKLAVRTHALEMLTSMGLLPPEDYWTVLVLVRLAGHPIPPEAADVVVQHFARASKNRQSMVEALVITGTEDAAKALIEAMAATAKRYLSRLAALLGEARKRGQLDPGFCRVLSDHLATRAPQDPKAFVKEEAASSWLLVDPERATAELTQGQFWRADFTELWNLLRALKNSGAGVAEQKLWALHEELRSHQPSASAEACYTAIVSLLARIQSSRVAPLIDELKRNPQTREDGLEAEAMLMGITSPFRVITRYLENPGYHESPAPIRHLWAVQSLHTEINNGGMDQYFFNSAGDLWPDALKGLEEAGYVKSAAAFTEAIATFGKTPPSTIRAERIEQLEKLSRWKKKMLDRHGEEVSKGLKEGTPWPYIMQHADLFRTEPPQGSVRSTLA